MFCKVVLAIQASASDVHQLLEESGDEIAIDFYDAVVFGSPLHYANHDARMGSCIRKYRRKLAQIPTAFFSVSL